VPSADLKRRLSSATDQPFGGNAAVRSSIEEKRSRGQGVLEGLSGARAGGRAVTASKASEAPLLDVGI
jgi:hypothetical protein